MSRRRMKYGSMALVGLLIAVFIAACGPIATNAAMCAFVEGSSGKDRDLHKILLPGQTTNLGDEEKDSYFPCNDRNYLVTDGSKRDANGTPIGDRTEPIEAMTSQGIVVVAQVSAQWRLNQSEEALREFYNICFKFTCASGKDDSGSSNNSTPGWSDMLGEYFSPAIDTVGAKAIYQVYSDEASINNPANKDRLAEVMSGMFSDELQARTGKSMNLFCGHTSEWQNKNKPGEGKYNCDPILIKVESVSLNKAKTNQTTTGAESLNEGMRQSAEKLYGEEYGGFFLGLQDTIEQCKAANVVCVFNIGGPGNNPVSVPVNQPAAEPTPKPQG